MVKISHDASVSVREMRRVTCRHGGNVGDWHSLIAFGLQTCPGRELGVGKVSPSQHAKAAGGRRCILKGRGVWARQIGRGHNMLSCPLVVRNGQATVRRGGHDGGSGRGVLFFGRSDVVAAAVADILNVVEKEIKGTPAFG